MNKFKKGDELEVIDGHQKGRKCWHVRTYNLEAREALVSFEKNLEGAFAVIDEFYLKKIDKVEGLLLLLSKA